MFTHSRRCCLQWHDCSMHNRTLLKHCCHLIKHSSHLNCVIMERKAHFALWPIHANFFKSEQFCSALDYFWHICTLLAFLFHLGVHSRWLHWTGITSNNCWQLWIVMCKNDCYCQYFLSSVRIAILYLHVHSCTSPIGNLH